MIEKCERSTKKNSLPEPLELAVLAFLFITPWGMTVGIALISPMLSLTSCGLRMQDPILKQKKNINAKSCQKNQINQDNQDNQVTHAKRSKTTTSIRAQHKIDSNTNNQQTTNKNHHHHHHRTWTNPQFLNRARVRSVPRPNCRVSNPGCRNHSSIPNKRGLRNEWGLNLKEKKKEKKREKKNMKQQRTGSMC